MQLFPEPNERGKKTLKSPLMRRTDQSKAHLYLLFLYKPTVLFSMMKFFSQQTFTEYLLYPRHCSRRENNTSYQRAYILMQPPFHDVPTPYITPYPVPHVGSSVKYKQPKQYISQSLSYSMKDHAV